MVLHDGRRPAEVYLELLSCRTEEDVARAVGESWTRLSCDWCGESVREVVVVAIAEDESETEVCERCLVAALAALRGGAR